MKELTIYIRSQNTTGSWLSDERGQANTYFWQGSALLAHVNLKEDTEAFQASEVYKLNLQPIDSVQIFPIKGKEEY